MADDDIRVGPRLAPPRPAGYKAPSTAGLNPSPATLDTRDFVKPRAAKDAASPYARRDEANDFNGFAQRNMRLVAAREAYQIVTASGTEIDIAAASYFIVRSVGGSTFTINLPTPPVQNDRITGDPIKEAWGLVVDIEYTGAGKPAFTGVIWPDDTEPAWSSAAGKMDTVVLTWAERWVGRPSQFGYSI